jgi:hypothetical protein
MLDVRAPRQRPQLVRATAIAWAAALVAGGAALGVGCGGDDSGGGRKLSETRAASLQATLDQIQQDVSASNCTAAGQQAATLRDQIASIRRVGPELRSALDKSAARLQSLVERQCEPAPAPAPAPAPEGETGATGETGPEGKGKKKGHEKNKKNKDETLPDEQLPPDEQGTGGAQGLSGESNRGGGNQP